MTTGVMCCPIRENDKIFHNGYYFDFAHRLCFAAYSIHVMLLPCDHLTTEDFEKMFLAAGSEQVR